MSLGDVEVGGDGSIERAVLERRIKSLEEEARVNKEFRNYVMRRLERISHEPETKP